MKNYEECVKNVIDSLADYEKRHISCSRSSYVMIQSEQKMAKKDAMLASLIAERNHVIENCCQTCKQLFDSKYEDAEILIREWNDGLR